MILSNKYRLIISLNSIKLRYQVVKIKFRRQLVIYDDTIVLADENMFSIEKAINQLLNVIYHKIPGLSPNKMSVVVFIDTIHTKQEKLLLPKTPLLQHEVSLFVEASIYKLFQLTIDKVAFDFVYHTSHKQQINVVVCDHNYVNKWIELFLKLNISLQFLGVKQNERLVINFLPWRHVKLNKQKKQLIIIMISYIFVIIFSFSYFWFNAQNSLANYSVLTNEIQIIQQELRDQHHKQMTINMLHLQQLSQFLTLLSQITPTQVWFESLHFSATGSYITGYSVSYLELLYFLQMLASQTAIYDSQIHSITINNDALLFEMEIKLK